MAWFDVLGGLAEGASQGLRQTQELYQQQAQRERDRLQLMEEMRRQQLLEARQREQDARQARLDEITNSDRRREQLKNEYGQFGFDMDFTPEEVAPYIQALGKGAFTVSPRDPTKVSRRLLPSDEMTAISLADVKKKQRARDTLLSPNFKPAAQSLETMLRLHADAGLNPNETGLLTTTQAKELNARNPKTLDVNEREIRRLQQQIELTERKAAAAAATAEERMKLRLEAEALKNERQKLVDEAKAKQTEINNLLRLIQITTQQGGDPTAALERLAALMPNSVSITQVPE